MKEALSLALRRSVTNPQRARTYLDGEAIEAGLLLVLGLRMLVQDPLSDGGQRHPIPLVQEAHSLRAVVQQCCMISCI